MSHCFFWPSWHNFENTELKFSILLWLTFEISGLKDKKLPLFSLLITFMDLGPISIILSCFINPWILYEAKIEKIFDFIAREFKFGG